MILILIIAIGVTVTCLIMKDKKAAKKRAAKGGESAKKETLDTERPVL